MQLGRQGAQARVVKQACWAGDVKLHPDFKRSSMDIVMNWELLDNLDATGVASGVILPALHPSNHFSVAVENLNFQQTRKAL